MRRRISLLCVLLSGLAACDSPPAELDAAPKAETRADTTTTAAATAAATAATTAAAVASGATSVIPIATSQPAAALLAPDDAKAESPATFKAEFDTSQGKFVIQVTRDWAPVGADRFYNLVKIGYFENVAFFRIKKGFMVQFGIHGDPRVNTAWRGARIQDDPVVKSNTRGMVTYGKTGAPNSRATQLFVNYGNNKRLDGMGFAPFGEVVSGMAVLDSLYDGYGLALGGKQAQLQSQGNAFLAENYPKVDYIKTARIQ
jgi:peptidyl-prolyl cis-trans isomerase A (cyclophilin A)